MKPGTLWIYGLWFCKIIKGKTRDWLKMIEHYLQKRKSLMLTFLVDRLSFKATGKWHSIYGMLGKNGLPFYLLFTKTDKLKPRQLETYRNFTKTNAKKLGRTTTFICTSAENKREKMKFYKLIENTNHLFSQAEWFGKNIKKYL